MRSQNGSVVIFREHWAFRDAYQNARTLREGRRCVVLDETNCGVVLDNDAKSPYGEHGILVRIQEADGVMTQMVYDKDVVLVFPQEKKNV